MKKEKIIFENSKGQKLVGVLYSPDSKDYPIAIFVHEYTSDKNSSKAQKLGEVLPEKGIGLFAIDLSGRGESEGKFENTTLTQYIDDLKCAIDEISKRTNKIGEVGSSLGGLVALQETAKDKRIKLLVLLSPVSTFPHTSRRKEFSPEGVKEWKEKGYTFTESGRFGKLKLNYFYYEDGLKYGDYSIFEKIDIPVLIIQGTADESIPLEETKELIKHLKNKKLILIKDADHRYTKQQDFDKVMEETKKFFVEKLK
jgi:alpha-beta hydrolase superfamily lysophospholipase